MRNRPKSFIGSVAAILVVLSAAVFTAAQTNVTPSRITRSIDPAILTVLHGNTHPLAQPRFDRGPAPASLPMQRMLLVLKRSGAQESALDTLLEQQQDASSPNYHHWLTPQQFGRQFGPSDQDIQTITSWLQSQGFQVDQVSNGRMVIEFSGTVGEVQSAFHTPIHQYQVNGENHWANSSDPEIPAALTPVVAGIDTLYNFPRTPMYQLAPTVHGPIAVAGRMPSGSQYTFPNPCSAYTQPCNFAVGPFDFATIYNVLPLWNENPAINGSGETIAIVSESDISKTDVEAFQKFFGLTVKDPNVITDGADPGVVPGDETESDLDVEWAGASAPGANIDLVVSQTTETSLSVDLSAQYIVDNNLASVLSESYGVCEFYLGNAGNQFYDQLWQQAAAQGITVVVATGDSGSSVCDGSSSSQGPTRLGLSVSGVASTPYNVAMGGTDFDDFNGAGSYWNISNSTPGGSSGGVPSLSAKGYIPEMTWNATCTNQELFSLFGVSSAAQLCNDSSVTGQYPFLLDSAGGSGGMSSCTSSDGQNMSSCTAPYSKPAWQTALTPKDGVRDLPDVAIFASNGFNGSFYVVCEADLLGSRNLISISGTGPSSSCDPSDPNTGILGIGGTSVPTPIFAGIMAMVDQAKNSPQGNANYILYKLAAEAGKTCSSAANPASTCVFYDIPSGSTISMPCANGTPDCTTTSGEQYGVLTYNGNPAYNTASGYDLATGLGSVNVANLVSAWKSFSLEGSSTTLTLTPPSGGSLSNLTHGQAVSFNASVSAVAPATGTPTGSLALLANTGSNGQEGVQSVPLSSGTASGTTTSLPGGTYTVEAQYAGDGTFGSSTSSGTSVTVNPEASEIQFEYELINPNTGAITNSNATTAVFGSPALLRVNVTSAAGDACANNAPGSTGCPTGNVTLTDSYNGGAATSLDGGTFALNPQGYAEDQLIDLAGGTHVLAASYAGDNSFSAPTPNPTTQSLAITAAPTTIYMNGPGSSVVMGSTVTLNAVIGASGIYSAHGPTGTVTFTAGTTQAGSATVAGGVSTTSHGAIGSAAVTTTSLPHGQNNIVAQYAGDGSYAASSSAPYSLSVLWSTKTTATASATSHYGSPVTLTAQVSSSQGGSTAITGTVSFTTDSGIALGSAMVSGGTAAVTTSAIPGGTHMIQVNYSGDGNYANSYGTVSTTVSSNSTTTALASSSSTAVQGQNVTLTATITPSVSGPVLPAGSVEFSVNGSSFGATFASNGQAQLITTSLPVGTDQITANYMGDSNYSPSTSSSVTVTIKPAPTFTVTANPTTINVSAPGQSGSTMVTFTGENGFTTNGLATVSATCYPLPAYGSCSISPSGLNIATNGTATTTLTVTTEAPSAGIPGERNGPMIGREQGLNWQTAAAVAIMLLLSGAAGFAFRGRERRWGLALALVGLAFVFANAGCGGGGGTSAGGGGGRILGTPAGTTPISVSFTINGITQTLPLTVNVQ
jgi:hypothetical protein